MKRKRNDTAAPRGQLTEFAARPNAPIGATAPEEPANDVTKSSAEPWGPNEKPTNWGPPYRAIYTNAEKGFELGEDRRWKQRVLKFKDKPDEQIRQMLKEAGFRYRPEDHAWTIAADAASRELSDRIAQQLAGHGESRSR